MQLLAHSGKPLTSGFHAPITSPMVEAKIIPDQHSTQGTGWLHTQVLRPPKHRTDKEDENTANSHLFGLVF